MFMNRQLTLAVIVALLGTACRAHPPYTVSSGFMVSSQQQGAVVSAMGQPLGRTPLPVTRRQVFPISYPEALQSEYGKVTLHYPGCVPHQTTVNNTILKEGLAARLQCSSSDKAVPEKATQVHRTPIIPGSTRQRLLELQELYEAGLVTEKEYHDKRRAILDAL
jgi:hypothetical protein